MNKNKKTLLIVSTVFCLSAVGAVVFSSAANHKSADIVKSENETYTLLLNYDNKPAAAGTSEEPTTFNYTPSRFAEFKYENVYKAHDTESIKRHISIANGGSISAKVCGLSTIKAAWSGEGALTIWYGVNSADEHAIRAVNGTTYNLFGNYIKLASTKDNKIEDVDFTITYSCGEEATTDNKLFNEEFSASTYDITNFHVDEFAGGRCSSNISDGALTLTPANPQDYNVGIRSVNQYKGNYVISTRLKNTDSRVMFYVGLTSPKITYTDITSDQTKGTSFEINPGNWVRANGDGTKIIYNTQIPSPKDTYVDYQIVVQSNSQVRIFANERLICDFDSTKNLVTDGYFGIGQATAAKDIYTIDSLSANQTDDYSADEQYSKVVNGFDYDRDISKSAQTITYEEVDHVLHIKGKKQRDAIVSNAYLKGDYTVQVNAKTDKDVESGRLSFFIGSTSHNTHWDDSSVTKQFLQFIPNNVAIKIDPNNSVTASSACPDMTADFVTFKFEVSTTDKTIKVSANNTLLYTFENVSNTEGFFRIGGGGAAIETWVNSFSITPIE